MLDHHIQQAIVHKLAFADRLRFSELKPDDIENKLFDYHLKKVIRAGYVTKTDDGLYALTHEGRKKDITSYKKENVSFIRAHSTLILIIRRQDGAWLLYQRHTHPLRGLKGFMHCTPSSSLSSPEQAAKDCEIKTGLTGDFKVLGNGYFRIFEGDKLESFTHFTLLFCNNILGELVQNSEYAEYFWQETPDFTASDMLPTTACLSELYAKDKTFHIEKTFVI